MSRYVLNGTDHMVWGSASVPITTANSSQCWWYKDEGGGRSGTISAGHFMNAVATITTIDPGGTPAVRYFRDYATTDADWSCSYANMGSPDITVWHHYCWTHVNGSQPKFYLDGVQKTVTNGTSASGAIDTTTSRTVEFGNRADGARPLLGSLSWYGIYERELTQGEVLEAMYNGFTHSPKWLYPFLGDSPEPNMSGVSKNLTITGATVTENPPIRSSFIRQPRWFERVAAAAPASSMRTRLLLGVGQ